MRPFIGMTKKTIQFPYRLPIKAIAIYYAAIGFALWIMLSRNKTEPWASLPKALNDWGQHVSNFGLTFMLFLSISLFWILQGVPRKAYLWLAGILLAINVFVELFVSILNTPDVVDIPFGVAGVVAGLGVVYLLNRLKIETPKQK